MLPSAVPGRSGPRAAHFTWGSPQESPPSASDTGAGNFPSHAGGCYTAGCCCDPLFIAPAGLVSAAAHCCCCGVSLLSSAVTLELLLLSASGTRELLLLLSAAVTLNCFLLLRCFCTACHAASILLRLLGRRRLGHHANHRCCLLCLELPLFPSDCLPASNSPGQPYGLDSGGVLLWFCFP